MLSSLTDGFLAKGDFQGLIMLQRGNISSTMQAMRNIMTHRETLQDELYLVNFDTLITKNLCCTGKFGTRKPL